MSAERVERIRVALQAALDPVLLEIEDDSHRHAGHAGAKDGRGHFNVHIVSAAFEGKLPLARHRAVYAALGTMMDTAVHPRRDAGHKTLKPLSCLVLASPRTFPTRHAEVTTMRHSPNVVFTSGVENAYIPRQAQISKPWRAAK